MVMLYNGSSRKNILLHRLVAQAFIPNPMNLSDIRHKDNNKANNCVDNLEWVADNSTRISKQKRPIKCIETGIIYQSCCDAGKALNISPSGINEVCTGYKNRQTASGYHWKFL